MNEVGKEYLVLFNGISKTVSELETTIYKLKCLQASAEEAYLSAGDSDGTPSDAT